MGVALGWLANAAAPVKPGDFVIPALLLVGGLLIAAVILVAVRTYGPRATATLDPLHDQLARFRTMYQKGQMSKAEYDRVRGLLAEKIREKELTEGKAPVVVPEPAPQAKPTPPREAADFEPLDPDEPPP